MKETNKNLDILAELCIFLIKTLKEAQFSQIYFLLQSYKVYYFLLVWGTDFYCILYRYLRDSIHIL